MCAALVAGSLPGVTAASAPPQAPDDGPRAFAWGRGDDGALGDGSTSDDSLPVAVMGGANALNTWGTSWSSLDGGDYSACGVGADGAAYCWGTNGEGQLGDNSRTTRLTPVQVMGGPASWVSVSAGEEFACGIGGDDSAYCWGANGQGQLGDDSTTRSLVPVRVVGGPGAWEAVSAGARTTCGLGTDDSAYCWGYNTYGMLGNGDSLLPFSKVPLRVAGGPTAWDRVAAGAQHSCGLGTDDSAYCWGRNNFGQLGNGAILNAPNSTPVRVQNGDNSSLTWKSVVPGYDFSCGIGMDDSAYCWGHNDLGQLGNNSRTDSNVPVRVQFPAGVRVRMLDTDSAAQFACALSTDDTAYCWGWNGEGQLGDGSTLDSIVPVPVQLGTFTPGTPRLIDVGAYASYMVSAFGAVAAPSFTAFTPPAGTVGTPYTYGFAASGTPAPTFSFRGSLPPGLTLNSATGVLSGTPTTGGSYTFTVRAANGALPDATTASITIVISAPSPAPDPVNPPSAPVNVVGVSGDRAVAVSWSPPASTGSFPISMYKVSASPGGASCLTSAPTTSCTVTGLTDGTAYTFSVVALNGAGWGPAGTSSPVTPGGVTPAPEPQPLPFPLAPGDSSLIVNGVPDPNVKVDPKPTDKGLTITGPDFEMDLDGLDGRGNPLNLGPDGVLILNQERNVQTSGKGFLGNSDVDLYVDPPVVAGPTSRGSRAASAIYVGTVRTTAAGTFSGLATLPDSIKAGQHVLQAVGTTPEGQPRAMSLGVMVTQSLVLNQGSRKPDGRHDRIRTTGSSTGIDAGVKLTPYIKYSGQTAFIQGKATIVVKADGTFTWTRQIRKDKAVTGYVAYTDITSNEVVWLKVR